MALNLKSKIALGGSFLFLLLITVGGMSFYFLNSLIRQSGVTLKNNYESLIYSKNMLKSLENRDINEVAALKTFEENLKKQESNITEPGEDTITRNVRNLFNRIKSGDTTNNVEKQLRKNIYNIMQLNQQAIFNKNETVRQTSDKAKLIITIILTTCLLVGFTFIFNFPGYIANPISKLTDGIKEIANKNYSKRVHLNRTDEFGMLADAFNKMAEKLDDYEHSNLARILFEKQRAETVIQSLKDASIGIDTNGNVLFANQQALQLLGLKETDIVGQNQNDVSRKNDLFKFLLENNSKSPFKIVIDNKEEYFTKEVMNISQNNQLTGRLIILENITPYQEKDVAKTNFIATISHELKTPLASSDFSLKLLEDERVGKLTAEQKDLVQSLKSDNQRLLRILSELLDLSQVESGKIELEVKPAAPVEIINKAELTVANAAKEKNIRIKKEVNQNLPLIQVDSEKSMWVLNNFLTNAIRYSPENGTIIIKAEKTNDNHVEIGVQDFAMGIDPTFQNKIFDRFFRVPGAKEKKGSGLGLAISKDFVEGMGGEIGLKSEKGKGSYFFSRFRIAQ